MIKRIFIIFIFLSTIIFPSCLNAYDFVMKTISARVESIDAEEEKLYVIFKHPATLEEKIIIFEVDNETGFSGISGLEDLEASDIVDIDYEEKNAGKKFIRRIAKVKLKGPPPGLKNFKGF